MKRVKLPLHGDMLSALKGICDEEFFISQYYSLILRLRTAGSTMNGHEIVDMLFNAAVKAAEPYSAGERVMLMERIADFAYALTDDEDVRRDIDKQLVARKLPPKIS